MKLNRKNILACALCAGLLTLSTVKTQATVVDNNLALNLNFQLTALTTTSKGKVQKTRITNKDLLNSIGDITKGDKLVYWLETDDVWIMDKKGVLQEDLNGIFELFFFSVSEISGNFSRSITGTIRVVFASAGEGDTADSNLGFDLNGAFSWTESFTQEFGPNNAYFDSVNFSLSGLGNVGHDSTISGGDDVPLSGSVSANGSGLLFD